MINIETFRASSTGTQDIASQEALDELNRFIKSLDLQKSDIINIETSVETYKVEEGWGFSNGYTFQITLSYFEN